MTTHFVPGKLYRLNPSFVSYPLWDLALKTVVGHLCNGDTVLLVHSEPGNMYTDLIAVLNVLVLTSRGILHRMCFYNVKEFQQLFSEVQP